MPTISKAIADQNCRNNVMLELGIDGNGNFSRTSNQSYETITTDPNGIERVVEVRFVVKTVSEDKSAKEVLAADIKAYEDKKAAATEKLEARRLKAEKDKAKREAAKAKKEAEAAKEEK